MSPNPSHTGTVPVKAVINVIHQAVGANRARHSGTEQAMSRERTQPDDARAVKQHNGRFRLRHAPTHDFTTTIQCL